MSVVIVGAGAAGLGVAEAPRREGFSGRVSLKFGISGLPRLADDLLVISSSARERRVIALYSRKGTVVGASGVNMFRDLRAAKALVAASAPMLAASRCCDEPNERTTDDGRA
ncbi:oxidoreductase C-terminal domain-containing protein [Mycolicibacterium hodleri]|uniref:Reductase C-terminal domain-containing protein n=1 Tax=Mycolicibacterium hodleri TaxID=49897 RepID=A0A502EHY8_9MYCO|nr:oxidoreductase C-terminal domain-containing protein [Mycolicibacterium hodleri]TPG36622.1 hypothetical protein EAH80_01315 [Mycolicibacterium hodleri]